jgi:hypothetical protein
MKRLISTIVICFFCFVVNSQTELYSFENIGFELPNGEIGTIQRTSGTIKITDELIKIITDRKTNTFEIIHESEENDIITYVLREFENGKLDSCRILFDTKKQLIRCERSLSGIKMAEVYYLKKG